MNFEKLLQSEFKNHNITKYGFVILGLIIIFLFGFKSPGDPDLGWHLKTGELIWQTKTIPHLDWYSYTMPDFAWIDHEWLTEILIYGIYSIFGYWGLSIAFALIIVAVFGFLIGETTRKKNSLESKIIIGILGVLVSWSFIGIRPQVLTLLGLVLVLIIVKKLKENEKTKTVFALPLLFLLWVNMHASFVIGLTTLGIIILTERIKIRGLINKGETEWIKKSQILTKKAWKKLCIFTTLSFLVVFINPYGYKLLWELKRTFTDSYGTNIIIEWLSLNFHSPEGIFFAIDLLIIIEILALKKSRIDPTQFVLLMAFLWLAFQSARHVPLFVIITIPFLLESIQGVPEKILSEVLRIKVIFIGLVLLSIIYIPHFLSLKETIKAINSPVILAEQAKYPRKAVEFLKENPQGGNMLNDYGFGGYLIWEYPKVKTFIDGRMAHWKNKDLHILKDYTEINMLQDNWQDLLEKHNVSWTLIKKDSALAQALRLNPDWDEIYQDDIAIIFRKLK